MKVLDRQISVFRSSVQSEKPSGSTTILDALKSIQVGSSGARKARQESLLNGKSENYNFIKKSLPAVTWNAEFQSVRKKSGEYEPSNVIYLDVDEDVTKAQILDVVKPLAVWSSLSGKGVGILVQYQGTHKEAFYYFQELLQNQGIQVDRACKDITRLNILSYDEDIYIDSSSPVYDVSGYGLTKTLPVAPQGTYNHSFEDVYGQANWAAVELTGGAYEPGNRYNYAMYLTSYMIRYGVEFDEFWEGITSLQPDFITREDDCIRWYEEWANSFGTVTRHTTAINISNTVFKSEFCDTPKINQRWTSDLPLQAQHQHLAVAAPKNTGKTILATRWIDEFCDAGDTVIVVTYRVTLVENLVGKLTEKTGYTFEQYDRVAEFKEGGKYVTTLDSLYKIPGHILQGACIVVDEIHSVIQTLVTSSTLKACRNLVWDSFDFAVSQAQASLFLDADMTEDDIWYLKELNSKIDLVVNEYLPKQGQEVELVLESNLDNIAQDLEAQTKDSNVFIGCATAETAEMIARDLPLGDDVRLVTAKTKINHLELLTNPSVHTPSAIVASPAIESGVSIENNHYDLIVGIYEGNHLAITNFAQQMARVRADLRMIIYCKEFDKDTWTTPAEELVSILRKQKLATEGTVEVTASIRTELIARVQASIANQVNNPVTALIEKYRKEGYRVRIISLAADEVSNYDTQALKDIHKTRDAQAVVDAVDVDREDFKGKANLTEEQQHQLHKAQIKHFSKKDEITVEDVRAYSEANILKTLRVELLNDTTNRAQVKDNQQRGNGYYFIDKDLWVKQIELLVELNLDYYINGCIDEGGLVMNDRDVAELNELCLENADDIRALFGINVTKYKNTKNLAKAILNLVGIETTTGPQRRENGKRVRDLVLTMTAQILEWVESRKTYNEEVEAEKIEQARLELVRKEEIRIQCELEMQLAREGKLDFSLYF